MKLRPAFTAVAVACATALAAGPALAAPMSAATTSAASTTSVSSDATSTQTFRDTLAAIMSGPGTYRERAHAGIEAAPGVSAADKARLSAAIDLLPADLDVQLSAAKARAGIHDTQWSEIRDSVIDPADYRCDDTVLGDWLNGQFDDWTVMDVVVYGILPYSEVITYEPLLFGQELKTNTFGLNGEYTSSLTSEMKNLRSFWDIPGSDVQLVPMHGAKAFEDREHAARTLWFIFGGGLDETPPSVTYELLDIMVQLLEVSPALRMGDHPIFTFNAYAFDPEGELPGVTKRIVVGDGILSGMAGVGIDTKVGPRSILAHEYGHQVQYADGLFEDGPSTPEGTRRTELMADAFSSYFLIHARGEALNAKRALDGQRAAFEVGDCSFRSTGHHGTPAQRARTAAWGASLADSAANQGGILPSRTFAEQFDAALPVLTAPDA